MKLALEFDDFERQIEARRAEFSLDQFHRRSSGGLNCAGNVCSVKSTWTIGA